MLATTPLGKAQLRPREGARGPEQGLLNEAASVRPADDAVAVLRHFPVILGLAAFLLNGGIKEDIRTS